MQPRPPGSSACGSDAASFVALPWCCGQCCAEHATGRLCRELRLRGSPSPTRGSLSPTRHTGGGDSCRRFWQWLHSQPRPIGAIVTVGATAPATAGACAALRVIVAAAAATYRSCGRGCPGSGCVCACNLVRTAAAVTEASRPCCGCGSRACGAIALRPDAGCLRRLRPSTQAVYGDGRLRRLSTAVRPSTQAVYGDYGRTARLRLKIPWLRSHCSSCK